MKEQIVEGGSKRRGRPLLLEGELKSKIVSFAARPSEVEDIRQRFPGKSMTDIIRRGLALAIAEQEAQAS